MTGPPSHAGGFIGDPHLADMQDIRGQKRLGHKHLKNVTIITSMFPPKAVTQNDHDVKNSKGHSCICVAHLCHKYTMIWCQNPGLEST